MLNASRSILLYVPIGNCYTCQLMTEGSQNDPWCHTRQQSSIVASATHSSQHGPRWKSLRHSHSVSAGISGQLGHKHSSLYDSPRLTFYHHNCHSLSHSLSSGLKQVSFLTWLNVTTCSVIHNVLCSSSKIPDLTLIAAWAVVMPPLTAWYKHLCI